VVEPVDLWDGHDTPERWWLHLAWPWTGVGERLMRPHSVVVDGMKRLASRSTWWHTLPHKSEPAVNAAVRRGQPWIILASDVHKRESQICLLAEGAN
jgi:hypothetical protein